MSERLALAGFLVVLAASAGRAQDRDAAEQIADAVRAAPESMRAGAAVLGYGGEPRPGDVLTQLRAGTNDLVCLADDPGKAGFHTACYHRSLDEFMVLGRRLRAAGESRSVIMDARYAALASGELTMPSRAALHSVSADSEPGAAGTVQGERRLTVVYVPGATGEELGIPTRPDGDAPWLMLAGTPWAHIMISR